MEPLPPPEPARRRLQRLRRVGGLKGVGGLSRSKMSGKAGPHCVVEQCVGACGAVRRSNDSPIQIKHGAGRLARIGACRRGWRTSMLGCSVVVGRLTERDRLICRLLDDHRVLTTAQVAEVGFSGERRARMRSRSCTPSTSSTASDPKRGGTVPVPLVLGPLGAALVGAEAGLDFGDLSWRRSLVHDLAASQRLAHLVGLNGFSAPCSDPLAPARLPARRVVVRTALCPRVGEVVRPDGYGIWTEADTSLPFLLEYDNGTSASNASPVPDTSVALTFEDSASADGA